MSYWNAYITGGSHRGVAVKRPHYIYASTDIHDSGGSATSGARRSYVYVKDGAAKSEADFESFSLEFAKSQAAGHSYSSSGVFITPTSGKMFGNTYRADADRQLHRDVQGVGAQPHHRHLRVRQHGDRHRDCSLRHEEPRLPDDLYRQRPEHLEGLHAEQ